jgi:hypothetical protein
MQFDEEIIDEDVTEIIDPLAVIPNQTNLLDQIAELTEDESVLLAAQYPVMEKDAFEIHVESDQEYLERVAEIEGEPEELVEVPEEIMEALMNAPEIDASEVDMSQVTWVNKSDTVQYTDPAGNTFEAPILDKTFMDDLEEVMVEQVQEDTKTLESMVWGGTAVDLTELDEIMEEEVVETAPDRVKFAIDLTEELVEEVIEEPTEDDLLELHLEELKEEEVVDNSLDFDFNPVMEEPQVEVQEEILVEETELALEIEEEPELPTAPASIEDPYTKGIISKELEELFGEEKDFTYILSGEQYVITFDDGSTVELDKEYIDLLS